MIKLSHSARGKHDHCPELYNLHYNEKIRPEGSTSSLLFGSAIDKACEHYMLNRQAGAAKHIFKETWKPLQDAKTNGTEIDYHKNDFDHELLVESDNELILKDTPFKTVSDLVKDGQDKERIEYANWISLYRKGLLLVSKFIEWVDENVAEVLGAQIPIELEDAEGNKVTGLADFVIKVNGYNNPIVVDLKTTSSYYTRGSVKESEQLALYYFFLKEKTYPDMERAAFLVLQKNIRKNRVKTCQRCGTITSGREQTCAVGGKGKNRCNGNFSIDTTLEPMIQYIHDEIDQEFIDQTINKFDITLESIKTGIYSKCFDKCDNYYGRRCPYYDYCRSGNMTGLIKKEKKDE